jgi:alcohol dehydrogenase
MIASALGARVVAVDVNREALLRAENLGAEHTVDASLTEDVAGLIRSVTDGGAQVSLDALGSPVTASNSVLCLRKRGRHVQVGLLAGGPTPLPMDTVIARELEIVGSHGLGAHDYPQMLDMIESRRIDPGLLLDRELSLDEVPEALISMRDFTGSGIAVVTKF